mmetsp:Transcript_7377/g.12418  ORF Transcript_7377/g.12418 Transcript_7377/m.12418 type:complete len:205 (+) Transcript_7377:36-650(+)
MQRQFENFKEWLADGGIVFNQSDQYLVLKSATVVAGSFVLVGGLLGTTALILGGGLTYFIGSLYSIFFGCCILVLEMKKVSWRTRLVYEWIEIYLRFLTVQRGKGASYLGVALLVFCIGPQDEQNRRGWGVNNVAAVCLAIVGVMHMLPKFQKVENTSRDSLNFGAPIMTSEFGDTRFSKTLADGNTRLDSPAAMASARESPTF